MSPHRPHLFLASVALLIGGASVLTMPTGVASASTLSGHLAVVASQTPAFVGDAPDPDVVQSGGTYYAFTTGTALGNHIQALVDTTGNPASGWGSYSGASYGSTALPVTPGWETPNTQTSPGVFQYDGHWVMFYDASVSPYAGDSGHSCLSVASAATLSPNSPVFTDSSSGPLLCAAGGVLDPSPFVDPATGAAYLLYKSNDGSSAEASQVWSVRLGVDGTSIAGPPTVLLTVDQPALPWETTVDDPQMVYDASGYQLLFSAGAYQSASYSEALTSCSGPLGPCTQPAAPFLTSYGSVAGPGGGSLFTDASGNWWLDFAGWPSTCTDYACGGVRRLFVSPIGLAPSVPPVVGMASTPDRAGYWEAADDGGVFSYGDAHFYGSTGSLHLNQPVVGMAATPDGKGYWLVAADGGIFSFGDAHFYGSTGGLHLSQPVVGIASTPDGGGYWLVAADGGIFSFGDAHFYGSTGSIHLNQQVVGMAATPDGKGYWLVARDGGIFSFGDAHFYGSTGSIHLNQPVVGMAATDAGGYWLVARDGGIFSFGDAHFYGSTGSIHLNQPVVGMAATDAGGYWLVAADRGIFTFGDAGFFGAG